MINTLFNRIIAPACLDGRYFHSGETILENAGEECRRLFRTCEQDPPCTDDEEQIIRTIYALAVSVDAGLRARLLGLTLAPGIREQSPMRIERVRMGWEPSPPFTGLPPLIHIRIDIGRFTFYPPFLPGGQDMGIEEVRLPRFSLDVSFLPAVSSNGRFHTFVMWGVSTSRVRDWSDPVRPCEWDYMDWDCQMATLDEKYKVSLPCNSNHFPYYDVGWAMLP